MRRRAWLRGPGGPAAAIVLALLLVAGLDATYRVGQGEEAVVSRLGGTVAVVNADPSVNAAGLYLKWPLVDQVVRLDRRPQTVRLHDAPMITADGRRLSVDAALRYRIADPVRFARAFGSLAGGAAQLRPRLDASLREAVARTPMETLAADSDPTTRLAQAQLNQAAQALGLRVTEVELAGVALRGLEAEAAGRRMQDQETQAAVQLRAEGEASKRDLMASADRDAAAIRGEGERQALEIRGQGDAERAAILSAAYGQDPGFARFFRRLEAYDEALDPRTTTLVLSPDNNAFLKLFGEGPDAAGR